MRGFAARDPVWAAIRSKHVALICITVLFVLGCPLCGSEDSASESNQRTWGDLRAARLHEEGSPIVASVVAKLRRTALAAKSGSAAVQTTRSSGVKPDADADALLQRNLDTHRQLGRRGLHSSALLMLHNLAELVLPRSKATVHRVFAESNERNSGVWAETYLCLLHEVHQGLRAERSRQEEIELEEDGAVRSEMSKCHSDLSQIQKSLIQETEDNVAIRHSLRVWQRIGQGLGENLRTASAGASSDSEAKATANIKRLKADRLRNDLNARGLQSQERLARIRCGLLEWQQQQKYGDLPPRKSRLLAQAEKQIDDLGLDAPALYNISRITALNVTLPPCSSRGHRRSSLLSRWLSSAGNTRYTLRHTPTGGDTEKRNTFDILGALQRSFQQASHNIFFDLTEVTVRCSDLRNKTHSDSRVISHQELRVLQIQGEFLQLQRTVATMETELVALDMARREAEEQASRLQGGMGDAHLGLLQRQSCMSALIRLQDQQDSASDKAAAKIVEMAAPKREIGRLRAVLDQQKEMHMHARCLLTLHLMRQSRCESAARSLRTSAGLIARHSAVLTHLAEDYRLESHEKRRV